MHTPEGLQKFSIAALKQFNLLAGTFLPLNLPNKDNWSGFLVHLYF